jgi:hypothetical protein
MYVVYQRMPADSYPIMIGVFLLKLDANDFINSQPKGSLALLALEEVEGVSGYWSHIREKLNQQVYYTDEEY